MRTMPAKPLSCRITETETLIQAILIRRNRMLIIGVRIMTTVTRRHRPARDRRMLQRPE